MSKMNGGLLIVAGVGLAAYALAAGTGWDREAQTSPRIAQHSSPAEVPVAVAAPAERAPLPAHRIVAPAPAPQHASTAAASESKPAPAATPQRSQPWPPFVTSVQREPAPPRLPLLPPRNAAGISTDRVTLARDLQRELRRVGCYDGEINGAWTPSTRRGMKAFMDRVNAMLPLEEPDYVLLALLKNHTDNACDKPCPSGQGLSEDGRCVPNAFLARPVTKGSARLTSGTPPKGNTPNAPPSAIVGWTAIAPAAPGLRSEPPPEGRMSLAGPRPDGSALSPAAPMSNAGVSLLPDSKLTGEVSLQYGAVPPVPAGQPVAAAQPSFQGSQKHPSWSRSFWKHRDSSF